MMDPAGFPTRAEWVAYLQGLRDGREEMQRLLSTNTETPRAE